MPNTSLPWGALQSLGNGSSPRLLPQTLQQWLLGFCRAADLRAADVKTHVPHRLNHGLYALPEVSLLGPAPLGSVLSFRWY